MFERGGTLQDALLADIKRIVQSSLTIKCMTKRNSAEKLLMCKVKKNTRAKIKSL